MLSTRFAPILLALLAALGGALAQAQTPPAQPGQGAPGSMAPGQSQAQGQGGQAQGQGGRRGPPPEALQACASQAAGASCSFTSPHGQVTGTCWAPEGRALACRPAAGGR